MTSPQVSLSTSEQQNMEAYWKLIERLDPELFLIKTALHETGTNPLILPKVIRALANLAYGTGYGKVEIFMSKHVVTSVNEEERDIINQDALRK